MGKPLRLSVLTTHPIQYVAPWYRGLAAQAGLDLEVLFLRELTPAQQGVGFGRAFAWDVPLRHGYRSSVIGVKPGWAAVAMAWQRLRAHLMSNRPDVLMITGWNEPALIAAYPLARLLDIPILLRGEANAVRPRSATARAMHRWIVRQVAAAVVIGRSNREFYLRNGMSPARLFPGAYFVETDRMLAMAAEHGQRRDELRSELGFAREDFVFCFVGKHVPFKRPMLLVEAAGLLRQRGLPVRLHIAGSGELTSSLQARAAALGVPSHFTGFLNQTEMWRAYVPADAFVLPSDDGETWGLVTNEAMLFGLPVIVSDQVGCGPDLVRAGETGYTFSGGADQLADAMARLMASPEQARAMGQRGRQLVQRDYSMPAATAGLMAALEYLRR